MPAVCQASTGKEQSRREARGRQVLSVPGRSPRLVASSRLLSAHGAPGTPPGPVPRGVRAAGRGRPSLVRVRGVLGPCCRVFVGCSPWASLRALRGRCSGARRCPQPAAPASCRADESAAGSLPLVSVSLSTPLTAAEMAPYMKRLSRGQSVEGESGGQGPPGPGRVDTQSSRCLPGHFLTVGAERVLKGEAGPRAGEGRHAGARAPGNAQGQGLLPFRGYPWRGGWQQTG